MYILINEIQNPLKSFLKKGMSRHVISVLYYTGGQMPLPVTDRFLITF